MKTWLKNPLVTWTANEHDAAGGIVIEDDVILELVSGAEPVCAYDNALDVSDCVLLPGLINCHHHFYQTLTRAFGPALNKELFEWLTTLYPYWAGLDEECIRVSTTTAIAVAKFCARASSLRSSSKRNSAEIISRICLPYTPS